MSQYSIVRSNNYTLITGSSGLGVQPVIVARLTPEVPINKPQAYVDFILHLEKMLSPTTAQSNPTAHDTSQQLMSDEEFHRAIALRNDRKRILGALRTAAVEGLIEVYIGSYTIQTLGEAATRGVLNQLMDDLSHNANAMRKLGVEPTPIDKDVAEAVEAALVVFLAP